MTTVRLVRLVGMMLLLAAIVMGLFAWNAYKNSSVIVDWSTASELDTAGFNLYRRNTENGPLIQINDFLIPSSSDPLAGGTYQYTDRQVVPGQTYYYQLEAVEVNGSTTRYGPIKVKAEPGGRMESVLACFLTVTSAFLLLIPKMKRKAQADDGY